LLTLPFPPSTSWNTIHFPAKSRILEPAPEAKVFWFFSSEKNKTLLFLKKKKQKDFYFSAYGLDSGSCEGVKIFCFFLVAAEVEAVSSTKRKNTKAQSCYEGARFVGAFVPSW